MNTLTVEELNRWAHNFRGKCLHEWKEKDIHPDKIFSDKYGWARYATLFAKCIHCNEDIFGRYIGVQLESNYCEDLNLAAEVEAAIPYYKRVDYANILYELATGCEDPWDYIHSTAEQRIRAAYETMEIK